MQNHHEGDLQVLKLILHDKTDMINYGLYQEIMYVNVTLFRRMGWKPTNMGLGLTTSIKIMKWKII